MIRDILHRYSITPRQDRGQHFLDDPAVVQQMVDAAELDAGDVVLEIGAGAGGITKRLAEAAGTVIAYENDPDLVRVLDQELAGYDTVDIRGEDALDADIPEFDACVSNIPFHRSTDVLDLLVERGKRSVLLVQEEFAQRLVAEPGDDQ
ncbi:MAG: rRNA adenine N-6-methyltransferase family protein, partial [Candidatus Nanohaloarchaea archaeon]|nr:rRNA adenine N-6-methyltransferase family protein [Candidatus Nanohaloarchaea archaeon]